MRQKSYVKNNELMLYYMQIINKKVHYSNKFETHIIIYSESVQ